MTVAIPLLRGRRTVDQVNYVDPWGYVSAFCEYRSLGPRVAKSLGVLGALYFYLTTAHGQIRAVNDVYASNTQVSCGRRSVSLNQSDSEITERLLDSCFLQAKALISSLIYRYCTPQRGCPQSSLAAIRHFDCWRSTRRACILLAEPPRLQRLVSDPAALSTNRVRARELMKAARKHADAHVRWWEGEVFPLSRLWRACSTARR